LCDKVGFLQQNDRLVWSPTAPKFHANLSGKDGLPECTLRQVDFTQLEC